MPAPETSWPLAVKWCRGSRGIPHGSSLIGTMFRIFKRNILGHPVIAGLTTCPWKILRNEIAKSRTLERLGWRKRKLFITSPLELRSFDIFSTMSWINIIISHLTDEKTGACPRSVRGYWGQSWYVGVYYTFILISPYNPHHSPGGRNSPAIQAQVHAVCKFLGPSPAPLS